ncbi:ribulose-1,5 bisphosphate carboxylase/oxygenase large subunit N-methyltransferase, chloroplastic isoform X2 [Malania oleifera]|uniref:ribulose-1,5 bisphosphate carboxylase/oxygenase large subunit N-methyltransferase, chloroplastic isoform X2 n=1 Tax=Malania oleifera TaxID=397392 RepID=UPI0025AE2CA2|nr:ribulose-1,5 bisphosphate carboxylase/oxygenase large subunit N-methyltransferase, chloroplastic isoform X2 [Malania oleifera]
MQLVYRFAILSCSRRCPLFTTSNHLRVKSNFSTSSSKVSHCLDEDCDDFLPWLRKKAGVEISTALSVGKSAHGRLLFACKPIQAGDCIFKVPYNVQIAPDHVLPEINSLFGDEIGNVAKLAVVILTEQKRGQDSEWAPYVSRLPQIEEMHSSIFWSEDELEMIRQSSLYQETIKQRAQIVKEFSTIKPAVDQFPEILGDVTLKDFMHAYALDFLNHDGVSEAVVLSDEDKQLSEVIADRNYCHGEQVFIRYGKFPNATLLLDFGFTLPYNIYDQVQIQVDIPHDDLLRAMKLELLRGHHTPAIKDVNSFNSSGDSFTIKEVRSTKGRGRGIPQSLRAFVRVLCSTCPQELGDFATEAAQNDGRLARRPLMNKSREIQAHWTLLSKISQLIEEYNTSIESLGSLCALSTTSKFVVRKRMALDLLTGELRVMKSAVAWLKNYCATLQQTASIDHIDYQKIL